MAMNRRVFLQQSAAGGLFAAAAPFRARSAGLTVAAATWLDAETLDRWSAPYRGWHYHPGHVISAQPDIPGYEEFHNTDVPCVYQLPGELDRWFMSFIGFNGQGYNSFVAESTDLVTWTQPRLAMGFGPPNEFDHGGCVIGAFLYADYDVRAPRILQRRGGRYWTLYGCYPRQGGYELRPGYEGIASSEDGLSWRRARNEPILSVHDPDCGVWEQDCIYQPWLVAHQGRFFNFYNAANGAHEQTGLAFSTDLLHWMRYPANPVIANRPGGYDAQFAADPKVFRDGDHWTMLYFGVGHGGAHIMAAFSVDLVHWTAHPEPLYRAGGHPEGLDHQYAHKISLVYHPRNDTFYLHYCAVGSRGRGIGLITSRPIAAGMSS
jgi:beta-xylosidase